MYKLYKIEDSDTDFFDFLITKDINKTMDYLLVLFKQNNFQNKIINYLISQRKKFYDLQKLVIYESENLEDVKSYQKTLEDSFFNNTTFIEQVKDIIVEKVKVIEENIVDHSKEVPEVIEEIIPVEEVTEVITPEVVEEFVPVEEVVDVISEYVIEKPKKKSRSRK